MLTRGIRMTDRPSDSNKKLLAVYLTLVVVCYFGAARLGLLMAFTHKNVSPVWPPSGFALAALLLLGTRMWPAIALGAFLANFSTGLSLATSLAICTGNPLWADLRVY